MTYMFVFNAREGPDMSEDSVKIFHRSLDLLQFWITDCKLVDFTPKSSFVETLENFINTEVTTQVNILLCTLQRLVSQIVRLHWDTQYFYTGILCLTSEVLQVVTRVCLVFLCSLKSKLHVMFVFSTGNPCGQPRGSPSCCPPQPFEYKLEQRRRKPTQLWGRWWICGCLFIYWGSREKGLYNVMRSYAMLSWETQVI